MKHRIFIAILIPEETKKKLVSFEKKLKNLSLRFARPENLHFTLAFIGWVDESLVRKTGMLIKEVAKNHKSFILNLKGITIGPDFKRPRMIWAVGERSLEIEGLWRSLREKLRENNVPFDDKYPLKVHLTLARTRGRELFGIKIDEKIDTPFMVREIALMESRLRPEGAEYTVLATAPLANLREYGHELHE